MYVYIYIYIHKYVIQPFRVAPSVYKAPSLPREVSHY